MSRSLFLAVPAFAAVISLPSPARAWEVGTQLGYRGCHELITAQALRNVRGMVETAPFIRPSRDETALFADVQFDPDDDMVGDVAGMALLLGVRDNDLKGKNPLSGFDLVRVHGDPTTQDEHCIRAAENDGDAGEVAALDACRQFIITRATEALDGLAADGTVDASRRFALPIYTSIAGHVEPPLPVFYVRIGQAMHAFEDGFTHTYRTPDGMRVTTVLNWIELVEKTLDEGRDGPPHRLELDNCRLEDPIVVRNYDLATQAATELLHAALDPALTREAKVAAFDEITLRYLTFEPGCTIDNNWCDAPEAEVTDPGGCGCRTSGAGGGAGFVLVAAMVLGVVTRRGKRLGHAGHAALVVALAASVAVAIAPTVARADGGRGRKPVAQAEPPAPQPPAQPTPAQPAPAPTPPDPTVPANADQPAVPAQPTQPGDTADVVEGKEPGRDEKTPTVAEVKQVREAKRLGSRLGFALNLGASVARGAAIGSIGLRYRINEKWLIGLGGAWNPWITTAPLDVRAGVVEIFATGIRRFPMRYDRVNLRTSLHVGTSTLLFDVYGAPSHSTGLFIAGSVLGLDYDLGNSLRLVIDPAEMAVAIPSMSGIPLWYEQFRFMIGLQYGS